MIEFDTGLPPAVRGEGPPVESRHNPQAWLREWEQARWNDQPRYQRSDDGGDAAAADVAATAFADVVAVLADATEIPVTNTKATSDLPVPDAAAGAVPVASTLSGVQGAAASTLTAALQPAQRTTTLPLAKATAPVAAAPSRAAAAAAEWAARSLHVHVDQDGTSVWIRDANLSVQQALQMLEKLRPTLYRAGAETMPLRLTLNGQTVAQHAAPLNPNSQLILETPSWQSNRSD